MPRAVGTPKTTRMRKLECACGNVAYQSRARIGQGWMTCPCGERFVPADPDDAAILMDPDELRDHPAMRELARLADNACKGQIRAGAHVNRDGKRFRSPDEIAHENFARIRQEGAEQARLNALRPYQYGHAAREADPIPF
jgi:hypothetical protein